MHLKEDIPRAQSAEAKKAEVTIMNTIRHGMSGFHIPAYMEEILTHNYCPYFVRMTIVREGDTYRLSYRPGKYENLDTVSLDTYRRVLLVRSIISIGEATRNYLVDPENYLIEPELVYSADNSTLAGNMRIMFYPDMKKMKFPGKLINFTERIKNNSIRDERELFSQFSEIMETGDINKGKMFLDKHLFRIENRSFNKAG